jgi:septum formation inhibitor-activating ATPase MinD
MTAIHDVASGATWGDIRALVGLSRAQERRLRDLWLEDSGLQVVTRCGSAAQLLEELQRGAVDIALVDEDLHRFDSGYRAAAWQAGIPVVALVREPEDARWRDVPGLVLPLDAELPAVRDSLGRASSGERQAHTSKSGARRDETAPSSPAGQRRMAAAPSRIQVLAFWSGRGHAGSTLLATSCAAILGSAAPTVLLDLDLNGAAVGVHLDDGQQARMCSSLADLLSVDLDSHEAWQRELDRCLQPLGTYAKHGQLLCGLPARRQRPRSIVSAAFVERLVAELRARADFVVLDLGSESPTLSPVTAAALRAADQVLMVATPDLPGLHRAGASVLEAAAILEQGRAALVINRYDARTHGAGWMNRSGCRSYASFPRMRARSSVHCWQAIRPFANQARVSESHCWTWWIAPPPARSPGPGTS